MARAARVGDPTDHDGKVLTGCATVTIDGIAAARVGDAVSCPRCGPGVIVTHSPDIMVGSAMAAAKGHLCKCASSGKSGAGVPATINPHSTWKEGEIHVIKSEQGDDHLLVMRDGKVRLREVAKEGQVITSTDDKGQEVKLVMKKGKYVLLDQQFQKDKWTTNEQGLSISDAVKKGYDTGGISVEATGVPDPRSGLPPGYSLKGEAIGGQYYHGAKASVGRLTYESSNTFTIGKAEVKGGLGPQQNEGKIYSVTTKQLNGSAPPSHTPVQYKATVAVFEAAHKTEIKSPNDHVLTSEAKISLGTGEADSASHNAPAFNPRALDVEMSLGAEYPLFGRDVYYAPKTQSLGTNMYNELSYQGRKLGAWVGYYPGGGALPITRSEIGDVFRGLGMSEASAEEATRIVLGTKVTAKGTHTLDSPDAPTKGGAKTKMDLKKSKMDLKKDTKKPFFDIDWEFYLKLGGPSKPATTAKKTPKNKASSGCGPARISDGSPTTEYN